MADTIATWTVELNCRCPRCVEDVDLLCADDFWHGLELEIAEHGTENSHDLMVWCPACGHKFMVDCEY